MQIRRDTLAALLAAAAASGRGGSVVVICSVEGGVSCRFAAGGEVDAALAARLVEGIGYKLVEHAPRREALIRCRPDGTGCEIDLGDGYATLPVTGEPGDA
jgi:hypothetical protein